MVSSTLPSYNSSPFSLLGYDITLISSIFRYIPGTILPLKPTLSGPLDELYPSRANLWCIFLHLLYTTVQLAFLVSLFFCVFPTVGIVVVYILLFCLLNHAMCRFSLNGRARFITSNVDLGQFPKYDKEKWMFINGVAVGYVVL
jgi:hypothetical protein